MIRSAPGRRTLRAQKNILSILAAGQTDLGNRQHNEDALLVRQDLHLYAVADGAGGPNAGNVASALGVATLASQIEATRNHARTAPAIDAFGLYANARRLAIAIQRANREIATLVRSSKRHRGMASTIVSVLMDAELGLMHLAHLGDSRCYRYRAGLLELLTNDHSLLNDVLEMRPETDDIALTKLPRQVVTRALGMEQVRVDVRSHEMLPGDKYLLCTDGVSGCLAHHEVAEALGTNRTPAELVADIVKLASWAGAKDNMTAIVVTCDLAPGSDPTDRPRPPSSPRAPSSPADPEILLPARFPTPTDPDPRFSVVPVESTSTALLDSKGHLLDALKTLISGPRQGEESVACLQCRESIGESALFCPYCGAPQRR